MSEQEKIDKVIDAMLSEIESQIDDTCESMLFEGKYITLYASIDFRDVAIATLKAMEEIK